MWYPAEIVLKSYLPLELEEGMLFINRISVGIMEPYVELWELEEVPEDMDAFMTLNGAPVELVIITTEDGNVRAVQDNIGWWDEGEHTDELREITLEDINYLLREFDGYVDLEFDDDNNDIVLYDGKVVLSIVQEDDDLEDWDVTTSEGLDE